VSDVTPPLMGCVELQAHLQRVFATMHVGVRGPLASAASVSHAPFMTVLVPILLLPDGCRSSPPPPPPPPDQRGFVECHLCALMLSGVATYQQHVRGTKHRRLQAAANSPPSSSDRATQWMCPLCATHNDAAASLFMHVNGSRHRRAIVRLREAGRVSETAPLVPRLRAAMAEIRRAGDDDALFGELLRNAEEDAGVQHGAGYQGQPADEGDVGGDQEDEDVDEDGAEEENNTHGDAVETGAVKNSSSRTGGSRGRRDASAPVACPSAILVSRNTPRADGPAHLGKRYRDSDGRGAAPPLRHSTGAREAGGSASGGVEFRYESRMGGRSGCYAGGASDVGRARRSSSPGGPTTLIVPPGARPWLECPRCMTLCASAPAFYDHPCHPPSGKGKGPARSARGGDRTS